MDLDPEEGLDRLVRGRGEDARDRIESEVLDFHTSVREAYLRSAEKEPERFVIIDARLSREEIEGKVTAVVDELLKDVDITTGRTP
jgi:dTMP kinase